MSELIRPEERFVPLVFLNQDGSLNTGRLGQEFESIEASGDSVILPGVSSDGNHLPRKIQEEIVKYALTEHADKGISFAIDTIRPTVMTTIAAMVHWAEVLREVSGGKLILDAMKTLGVDAFLVSVPEHAVTAEAQKEDLGKILDLGLPVMLYPSSSSADSALLPEVAGELSAKFKNFISPSTGFVVVQEPAAEPESPELTGSSDDYLLGEVATAADEEPEEELNFFYDPEYKIDLVFEEASDITAAVADETAAEEALEQTTGDGFVLVGGPQEKGFVLVEPEGDTEEGFKTVENPPVAFAAGQAERALVPLAGAGVSSAAADDSSTKKINRFKAMPRKKRLAIIIAAELILAFVLAGGVYFTMIHNNLMNKEAKIAEATADNVVKQVPVTLGNAETKTAAATDAQVKATLRDNLLSKAANLEYIPAERDSDVENSETYKIVRDAYVWDGAVISTSAGAVTGPNGRETYYNLDMSGVVGVMRAQGNSDPYWVRSDGCKMLGNYIMVAANLNVHPRGSIVRSSRGLAIVCDTGGFASGNPQQLDIAVNW
jgi:hypothetical protein